MYFNYRLLIIFFAGMFGALRCAQAQLALPALSFPELRVEGAGLMRQAVTESGNEHTIFTAGGFIRIQSNDNFYYKGYFNTGPSAGNSEDFTKPLREVYLRVNDTYSVELTDKITGNMVKRYVIKRVKIIPDIQFRRHTGDTGQIKPLYTGETMQISLKPDELIDIVPAKIPGFTHSEMELSRTNLKSGKTDYHVFSGSLKSLKFNGNTNYVLRFNYKIQPESTGVLYVSVKPYWYQSAGWDFFVLLVSGIFLIILVIAISKRKLRIAKDKYEKLEQSALMLQSQLNPHFTFNALSSVQGLMNTGRIAEANDYLQDFSLLLRQTLLKSRQVYNSLDQELDMMRTYIRLEALRFNFVWDINVSETLHQAETEIPTLLIQPLIENAIKHGLAGAGDAGRLELICKETEKKDTFMLIIKDNGKWKETAPDSGYGLSLTRERIRVINKLRKGRSIDIIFNKQSGTEVTLIFHHWLSAE